MMVTEVDSKASTEFASYAPGSPLTWPRPAGKIRHDS